MLSMGATAQDRLGDAISLGQHDTVREMIEDSLRPGSKVSLDINAGGVDSSPLRLAVLTGGLEMVEILLKHPHVNVNRNHRFQYTVFNTCCQQGKLELVRLLLVDPRVDVNQPDNANATPLWYAINRRNLEVVKWMIALRGQELDVEKKAHWFGAPMTALERARDLGAGDLVELLLEFSANRQKTIHNLRVELRFLDGLAAGYFAIIIFLCDDFVTIKDGEPEPDTTLESEVEPSELRENGPPGEAQESERALDVLFEERTNPGDTTGIDTDESATNLVGKRSSSRRQRQKAERARRFLRMAVKLPIELHMVLCFRACDSPKTTMLSKESEPAFKSLAAWLLGLSLAQQVLA